MIVFVSPKLFWLTLLGLVMVIGVMTFIKRNKRAYVDKMQQNVVILKIKNPIMTGFEVALGVGLIANLRLCS